MLHSAGTAPGTATCLRGSGDPGVPAKAMPHSKAERGQVVLALLFLRGTGGLGAAVSLSWLSSAAVSDSTSLWERHADRRVSSQRHQLQIKKAVGAERSQAPQNLREGLQCWALAGRAPWRHRTSPGCSPACAPRWAPSRAQAAAGTGQGTQLECQLKSQQVFFFQTGIFRCQKCGIFLSVPSEVYGNTHKLRCPSASGPGPLGTLSAHRLTS